MMSPSTGWYFGSKNRIGTLQRETYRQGPCGLIFSLGNREPDARFCWPGHARQWAQSVS